MILLTLALIHVVALAKVILKLNLLSDIFKESSFS